MKNRTIVAEEIPVTGDVLLAGGVRQFRWQAPEWLEGPYMYRVYLDGRLAAVTQETRHHFQDAEGPQWADAYRVEVYVEIADDGN